MHYYEVVMADGQYHSDTPLTYSYEGILEPRTVVSVPLRNRLVTGFVIRQSQKPRFATKPIKSIISKSPLPKHNLELAKWLQEYYACSYGDALRQLAPSRASVRQVEAVDADLLGEASVEFDLDAPLTKDQVKALKFIRSNPNSTTLLHGDTGTGKTRVYLELARDTLQAGKSVIILTPEIALTSQLSSIVRKQLQATVFVIHSQLTVSARKKLWLAILESTEPVVIIGPRSALFSPIKDPGLIVLDEAHEPAYKQEQSPRYHAGRVASQLALLTGAKVVLGTATPSVADYYLASQHNAVVSMTQKAADSGEHKEVSIDVIDLKDRSQFTSDGHLSKKLLESIKTTLAAKQQVLIYLNRRGSARLILCTVCGWQLACPNCDIPMVYHADKHSVQCHTCGFEAEPPLSCPECSAMDVVYKSAGTKTIADSLKKHFPQSSLQRFDGDNIASERITELYPKLRDGEIDIIVGTQLLAKGFDLPKLGLVGIVLADTSLFVPDYTAEERTYQLLYQVMGRVGRGHSQGRVVIQSYNPDSTVIQTAAHHQWPEFYDRILAERQAFRFPPYSYLMKLVCRRATSKGAENAAHQLQTKLRTIGLPIEVIGPSPSFHARRANAYYWQLVVKSKQRNLLVEVAKHVPSGWTIDLDPIDLL